MEGKNWIVGVNGKERGCAETTKPHTDSEHEGMPRQKLHKLNKISSTVDTFSTEKSHQFLSLNTESVFWGKQTKMLYLNSKSLNHIEI